MRRVLAAAAASLWAVPQALAGDWGMREANEAVSRPNMFEPVSTPANEILSQAIFVLLLSGAIFVVVAGLLAYAVVRFRARPGDEAAEPAQIYGSNQVEVAWTVLPVLIAFVLLLITARMIYTVQAAPIPAGAVRARVVGHQWWWEIEYPELGVVTANELHVPVSDPADPTPTFLDLESADVVHSFWVPRLAGKTDLVPNKRNQLWIDPQEPGTYIGQCAEYCGTQHAHMLLRVIVHPRAEWEQWIAAQREAANPGAAVARGRAIFESTACINCHTVRGTVADGRFGPDLTHLMSRDTLGAGVAINSPEHLAIWVKNPSTMKPGVLMPVMELSDQDRDDLVAYLAALE